MFTIDKGGNTVMVWGFANAVANARQFVEYCQNEIVHIYDGDDKDVATVYWCDDADGAVVI